MAHGRGTYCAGFAFFPSACGEERMQRPHKARGKPCKRRKRQHVHQGKQRKRSAVAKRSLRKPARRRIDPVKAFRKLYADRLKVLDHRLHIEGKRHYRKDEQQRKHDAHAIRAPECGAHPCDQGAKYSRNRDGQERRQQHKQNEAQYKPAIHRRMGPIGYARRDEHDAEKEQVAERKLQKPAERHRPHRNGQGEHLIEIPERKQDVRRADNARDHRNDRPRNGGNAEDQLRHAERRKHARHHIKIQQRRSENANARKRRQRERASGLALCSPVRAVAQAVNAQHAKRIHPQEIKQLLHASINSINTSSRE